MGQPGSRCREVRGAVGQDKASVLGHGEGEGSSSCLIQEPVGHSEEFGFSSSCEWATIDGVKQRTQAGTFQACHRAGQMENGLQGAEWKQGEE